jgi:hypothetical protein
MEDHMTATTFVAKRLRIGNFLEMMAGLRLEIINPGVRRYGYQRSPQLKARQYEVIWGKSAQNPEGNSRWAADVDIDDKGDVNVPHDAVKPYFLDKEPGEEGHLMLNIYCDMPRGSKRFATLGFKGKSDLYGFDTEVPQDSRGWWTYSRPIHLKDAGKFNFFFLMTLESTGGPNVKLTVYKIKVHRGNEHYHIRQEKFFPSHQTHNNGVTHIDAMEALANRDPELRDLPIAKLVQAYKDWNS